MMIAMWMCLTLCGATAADTEGDKVRLVATPLEVHVPAGPTALAEDASGRVLVAVAGEPCTKPRITDQLGNTWWLRPGEGAALELWLRTHGAATWTGLDQATPVDVGERAGWLSDDLGYLWVVGSKRFVRFDPRHPSKGWAVVHEVRGAGPAPTAVALSPHGRLMVGFDDGSVRTFDRYADGSVVTTSVELAGLPRKPIRALLTDRDGAIWLVVGGRVWRTESDRPWRRLASMPVSNHDVYGVVVDDRLYVAGGITDLGCPVRRDAMDVLWAYDLVENRWDELPPMSKRRGYCGIAALAGEIWVLGGFEAGKGDKRLATDRVEIYDIANRAWRAGPKLDRPRAELVALTIDERLYVIGGADEKGTFRSTISIGPGEQTWRAEPDAPRSIRQAAGCVHDGRIYLLRGPSGEDKAEPGLFVFEPKQRRWQADLPAMPEGPPNAPLVTAYRDEIWVMGGWGTKEPRAVWCYAPDKRSWRRGPDLTTPLAWGAAAEIDGRLLIAGGAYHSKEHHGFVFTRAVWMLR